MATTFYLPYSETTSFVANTSINWTLVDTNFVRRRMPNTKIGYTDSFVEHIYYDTDITAQSILMRQYISDPLQAQSIPIQNLEIQLTGFEMNSKNNMYFRVGVLLYDSLGSHKNTILTYITDDLELSTSNQSRTCGVYQTNSVTTAVGDRIVIDIGIYGDPQTGGSHSLYWMAIGCNGTALDLPQDNTSSYTDRNSWVKFETTTIAFDTGNTINFNTPTGTPSSWTWKKGSIGSESGMKATSSTPTSWSWGTLEDSNSYFYPSGNPLYWKWKSGSSLGG